MLIKTMACSEIVQLTECQKTQSRVGGTGWVGQQGPLCLEHTLNCRLGLGHRS